MSIENVLVALSIMLFITIHSLLLLITFLLYVSCSVTYTFEFLIGYWSYSVNWHTTNDGPWRAQPLTEEEEEIQSLIEEEALAVYNMFNENKGTLIEDEGEHLHPMEDVESEQILPFQRTGDWDWNPTLQTWIQAGDEREPGPAWYSWDNASWGNNELTRTWDDWATCTPTPEPPPPYPHEEFNDLPELKAVEEVSLPVLMIANYTEEDYEEEDEEEEEEEDKEEDEGDEEY